MASRQFDPQYLKSIPSLSDLLGLRDTANGEGVASGNVGGGGTDSPSWWQQFAPDQSSGQPGGQLSGQPGSTASSGGATSGAAGSRSDGSSLIYSDAHSKSSQPGQTLGPPVLHSGTGQYMGAYEDQATTFAKQHNGTSNALGQVPQGARVANEGGIKRVTFQDGSQAVVTPRNQVVPAKAWDTGPLMHDPEAAVSPHNEFYDRSMGIPNPSPATKAGFSASVTRGVEPDYVSVNVGILSKAIPGLKLPGGIGTQDQVIVDRYGNIWASPPGVQGGRASLKPEGGASVTAGWLDRNSGVPGQGDLKSWLQGWSGNATIGGGTLPTAGATLSKGNHGLQAAYELGIGTKQVGGSIVDDVPIGRLPMGGWDRSGAK